MAMAVVTMVTMVSVVVVVVVVVSRIGHVGVHVFGAGAEDGWYKGWFIPYLTKSKIS